MSRTRPTSLAVVAALLLAVAPLAAPAADPVAIHVGTSGKESDAQVFFAQDAGIFQKHGLAVAIDTLANGSAIAAGVASGALQFGNSNIITIAAAREKGLPFVIVAGGGQYATAAPTTLLVTAPANPAKSARDLNGKVVAGVSLRGLDDMAAHAWIDQNGGDSTTIKYIEVPPGEMVAALERGTIDAAVLPEPLLSASRARTRVLGKVYDAVAKQFLIAVYFGNAEWTAKNPAVVKAFVEAIAESAQWANVNRERAAAILEKYTKVVDDPAQAHTHITFAQTLDPAFVQPVLDAGLRYKLLAKPVAASELVWK